MAYTTLKDDYQNDVLNTVVNTNVKYIMVDNGDGTISLQDATSYTTMGDAFGASDINATNGVVNTIGTDLTVLKTTAVTRDGSGNVSIGSGNFSTTGNASIGGSATVTGNITVESHGTPMGWYDAHTDTTSVSSGTSFASISGSAITLSAGRYLLLGSARFAGNATGYRGICIFKGSSNIGRSQSSHPAIPSASFNTTLNCSCFDVITSSTTYYLGVFQNSGGALNVTWDFYAVRIR